MNKLRFLQYDDLLILRDLADGLSVTSIGQRLSISQPAVTQRIKKIEMAFEKPFTEKFGRQIRLTSEGREIAAKANLALSALGTEPKSKEIQTISIGVRPDIALSWLYPAVKASCLEFENVKTHIYQGAGEDILQRLGNGRLDAVVTSAPVAVREFNAIDLKRERYFFVASAKIAKTLKSIDDLEGFALIEHDRSLPFQRYLNADMRMKLKFRDVLFLGGTRIMAQAISDGLGVGIVPEFAAEPHLRQKKMRIIFPKLKIEEDIFRLIYRRIESSPLFFESLARQLRTMSYNTILSI